MWKNGTNIRYANAGAHGKIVYAVCRLGGQYDLTVRSACASVVLRGITQSGKTADAVCALLAEGVVFPENVYEILDDCLGVTLL